MQANELVFNRNHVLPRGRLLSIRDGRDTIIYVIRGCVWVTQEGDLRDRELGPGDWFQLDRDGLAIVQSYERSAVTLTSLRDGDPGSAFRRLLTSLFAPAPHPARLSGRGLSIMDESGSLRLADGRAVTVRIAAPGDAARVQAFVRGLSLEARRGRWFAPLRELPARELDRITARTAPFNESLVALDASGQVVGLAEYVLEADRDAEFAVVVADDWRRIGFGSLLVSRLIADAAHAGLNSLRALVLAANPAMLGLAGQLGFARRRDRDPCLVRIERELTWNN